jgi:hypothetical protein
MLARTLTRELLDVLPADDPAAIRSRRDLRLLNRIMMHPIIVSRLIKKHVPVAPAEILEIGAGDGCLMLRIARHLSGQYPGVRLTLLDRQSIVSEATRQRLEELGWHVEAVAQDVFDYLNGAARADVIVANLFLHHFQAEELGLVFRRAAEITPCLIACEPHRSTFPLLSSHLIGALGCNYASRHDAVASVRAGFRDGELTALWPDPRGWQLYEGRAGPFTHYFVAKRC